MMRPRCLHSAAIRPQFSTMPRPQTEATAYLSLYKIATEKKRLLQELETLAARRDNLLNRLAQLEIEAGPLEIVTQQANSDSASQKFAKLRQKPAEKNGFDTFLLEY
jgi:predicted nuclease with TOPRIM domain